MNAPRTKLPKCAACRSVRNIEWHHVAGRLFDLLVALCSPCHEETTTALSRLRIETSKKKGSPVHGCRALVYFLWFFIDKYLERIEKGA